MHCMWAALVLLLLYMLTIFLGSRVLDIFLWCTAEQGRQLVDPFVLSVRQLKQLLETRGISHTGYIEKQELAQLVKDSADVSEAEVSDLNNREDEKILSSSESFEFTGSAHFYEQVEDTKDSVWLVQVIPAGKNAHQVPLLDDYTWKFVHNQVSPFAVRTGIFNCNYAKRLCRSKGWFEPLLLLALPRGTKPKDKVVLRTSQFTKPQAIIKWLREELSIRVHKVSDVEELESDWTSEVNPNKSSSSLSNDVKVLLFTHLIHPPLFLAALSIKFTGRIKFGMFTLKKSDSEIKKRVKTPSYVIITPEGMSVYGQRKGEHFNFKSMETFLRTIQPEINDIFVCSLLFVNMIVMLQILQVSANLWWKKFASALWIVVSYNLFLFWIWIVVFAIRRWPLFSIIIDQLLMVVRFFWMSDLGTMVRSDCQLVSSYPAVFAVLFFIFGYCLKSCIPLRLSSTYTQQGVSDERAWWDVLPLDCLFRPISASSTSSFVTISAPHTLPYVPVGGGSGPLDVPLEEGIELLIERLAFPNLWLQSHTHNSEYIKDLPVWKIPSRTEETDEEAIVRMMDNNESKQLVRTSGEDCAVCLESYQMDDTLSGLPCGHSYHQQCLLSWLHTDNHHCPICRWPAYKSHPNQHKYHNQ